MATQISLNNAVSKLQQEMSTVVCNADTATYWTTLLNRKYVLHSNGTVQSTCSNPVAYFLVPLSGDGTKGRSHEFTLAQFNYALTQGLTKNAHVVLRGVDESAIKAGMSFARPRSDSNLGTVEGRLAASMVSSQSNVKARQQGAKQVITLETAKLNNNRAAFENASLSLAAIIEKYSKVAKPAKPETAKPENKAAKKA